jgi:segregation and condensation protein B
MVKENESQKNTYKDEEISNIVEAILFISPTSVSINQLSKIIEVTQRRITAGVTLLEKSLENRGINLQSHDGLIQLTSSAESATYIEKFLTLEIVSRLSAAATETLSIIAYQQPISRPIIDSIRGVNSDGVIRSLLNKGLLEERGRTDGPGRPILYGTTKEFLQHFGLNALEDLPTLNLPTIEDDNYDEKFSKQGELPIDKPYNLLRE